MARGRKKKVVEEPTLDILPERVQRILQEVKQKEDQEFKDEITSLIKARKGEWDVTVNDDIPFLIPIYPTNLQDINPLMINTDWILTQLGILKLRIHL